MNRIYRLIFVSAILALLLLSGCGGDSGSEDGGDGDELMRVVDLKSE